MSRPLRAFLAALALLAAGCGAGFDETRENAKPLKVAHASGESKVPGLAERPLALSDGALDAILALGERPVAALLPGGRAPPICAGRALRWTGAPAARTLLRVAVLDPDVILGSKATRAASTDV